VAVALALPQGGQESVRLGRVYDEVDDAGAVVLVQDLVPGLAAVARLVDAAVLVGAVQAAEGADVDGVRVLRVDDDLADLVGLLEADVRPGLAAVGALVDAVAVRD